MHTHDGLSTTFVRFCTTIGTVVSGAAVIAACSSSSAGPSGNSQTQLAFMTSAPSAGFAASAATAPVTSGGHTLDLTQVTLTVDRAELKRVHTDACAGDHDESDDAHGTSGSAATNTTNCAEVKIGPTTVDLPLTPGLVTVAANAIPVGTYRVLAVSVSQVRLKGTYDGTAFDVLLPVKVRQEIELSAPLVVADGKPASITVNVPVSGWLVNNDHSLVDPSKILADPSLLAALRARIAASFRAFEDDNHNGKDEHGQHG